MFLQGDNVNGVLEMNDLQKVGRVVAGDAMHFSGVITEPDVVIDSRAVRGGEIFVALKGEKTDGHEFVDEVFSKGASWAMVSRAWFESRGSVCPSGAQGFIVTEDTVAGLQLLGSLYRGTFSIPVIAVGGSNGKTTTKEMMAAVLGTGYAVHMSRGNMNNHLGVPLTLLQIRRNTDIAVVEMGINHPGEMIQLASLARPTHGLLTNIGHEHLEFLVDLDGVAAEELALFDYLRHTGGTCFVNRDDSRLNAAGSAIAGHISYGLDEHPENMCFAKDISVASDGRICFTLCSVDECVKVSLNFTGRHNVINAVAAATVGRHFGLDPAAVAEGLGSLVPAPGWKRLEVLDASGIRILNDTYNANSDSVRRAIDALCDMPCDGRRIAVLADMLELGAAGDVEHEAVGRYIQQRPLDLLFTFGDKARLVCREAAGRCGGHFDDRQSLLETLKSELRTGDVVLFKGSRGMKLEQFVEAVQKERKLRQA
jgi:UDP-N-acetylmuramoyl-tripeptide--D-alanyl-D-alanine ligase